MITENVEYVTVKGYEDIFHFTGTDFSAYIALHSTKLGPALGGCRLKRYASDDAALEDALLLSRGMSYKNSLAGLNFGGGKCVVNADAATPEIMRLVGKAVESLKGMYITAEDVGTTVADMKFAAEETKHIASLGAVGDPSPWTALGLLQCILTAADYVGMSAPNVWVQGLGKVGMELTELLSVNGYKVYVSDLNWDRVNDAVSEFDARPYTDSLADNIDIYAPCAMGQVVTSLNVGTMKFPVICGSANNQLEHDFLADVLKQSHVLYCPDFLVNAGGVIAAGSEITGYEEHEVNDRIYGISGVLDHLLYLSEHLNATPLRLALGLAEARW